MIHDDAILEEIRNLVGTARMALDEAEGWLDEIRDPAKRAAAEKIIEADL